MPSCCTQNYMHYVFIIQISGTLKDSSIRSPERRPPVINLHSQKCSPLSGELRPLSNSWRNEILNTTTRPIVPLTASALDGVDPVTFQLERLAEITRICAYNYRTKFVEVIQVFCGVVVLNDLCEETRFALRLEIEVTMPDNSLHEWNNLSRFESKKYCSNS